MAITSFKLPSLVKLEKKDNVLVDMIASASSSNVTIESINLINNSDYQTYNLVNIQQVKGEDLEIKDKKCEINEVKTICQELLPDCITLDYVPHDYEFRESLPKTKIGKVDFRELARQEAERQEKEKK